MNEYIYFDAEHAVRVHDQIIINSGGILGIINYGLLESSIEHTKNDYTILILRINLLIFSFQ